MVEMVRLADGAKHETSHDVRVGRQPIFDRRKRVYGYELLFRSGIENTCPPIDGTEASRNVLHVAWLDLGLQSLIGPKLAFVNVTQDMLVTGHVSTLTAESFVVEILESVQPTDDVIRACRELKRRGYILALDDFVYRPSLEPLMALADIVKIGFGECDPAEQCDHVRRVVRPAPKLLAEKVETLDDYRQAITLGFDYFQGYFFERPEIVTGRALTGSRLTHLKLIQAVTRPEIDMAEVERVITSDVSIAHRFLKYLGSAAFPWRAPIRTVHQALVLLGEQQTRRWASLMSLNDVARDKPAELLVTAAVRAKFCDELGGEVGTRDRKADLFLVGAFSLIDTMLGQPMEDVLAQLPLDDELKATLRRAPNPLSPVLDFVQAYEHCDWESCGRLGRQLVVDDSRATSLYHDSVTWAMESFAVMPLTRTVSTLTHCSSGLHNDALKFTRRVTDTPDKFLGGGPWTVTTPPFSRRRTCWHSDPSRMRTRRAQRAKQASGATHAHRAGSWPLTVGRGGGLSGRSSLRW